MELILKKIFKSNTLIFFLLGLFLAFGQMPIDMPLIAFSSLVFLGWIWQRLKLNAANGIWLGFALGIGYFSLTFIWIIQPFLIEPSATGWLAPFALIGMILGLSSLWAVALCFAAVIGIGKSQVARLLILWALLSVTELVRSEFLFQFPWGLISAMWINTPISQTLSVFGPYWLTSITILSALLISKPIKYSFAGTLVLIILVCFGLTHRKEISYPESNQFFIRIIQPNIPQSEKWKPNLASDLLQLQIELSNGDLPEQTHLIIWPETAISFFLERNEKIRRLIGNQLDTPLILGARRFDVVRKELFNSAYLLSADATVKFVYDKIKLVPFGEYIPFGWLFSNFGFFGLATDGVTGFTSGTVNRLVKSSYAPAFVISICYETIFTSAIDKAATEADWLLQLTNDAWFGNFSGPYQHLSLARMRSIEQGLPTVRVANTGISAIIDPFGRIIKKIDLGQSGKIDSQLPMPIDQTFYSKIGSEKINFGLSLVLMLTILILLFIKRSRLK